MEHAHGKATGRLHLLHGRARLRQGVRQLRQPGPRRERRQVHPGHPVPGGGDAGHARTRACATSTRRGPNSSRSSTWWCSAWACRCRRASGRPPGRLGLDLNEFGFAQTDRLAPLATSRPGLYVAGAFQEPKDIPESVAQASAAAACAMEQLAPARGLAGQAPGVPLGARHHRRGAPGGRVRLPLRPEHLLGHRREAGGREGGAHAQRVPRRDEHLHLLRHQPAARQGHDQGAPAQPAGGGFLLAAHARGRSSRRPCATAA